MDPAEALAGRLRAIEARLAAAERARITADERARELAVDLARTRERSRTSADQAELLLAGDEVMNETREIGDLFRGMLDLLRGVLGFEDAFIVVLQEGGARVVAATDPRLGAVVWVPGEFTARACLGRPLAAYDVDRIPEWAAIDPAIRAPIRSALHVPLRGARSVALLVGGHHERGFFTAERVALARRFAGLARSALRRAEYEGALRERTADLEVQNRRLGEALDALRRAQAQLVQAEKMASLGLLVAGIAHEVKNPLNFVNNFAELSIEFADELDELAPALAGSEPGEAIAAVLPELSENLRRIREHGRRANAIIDAMLLHARAGGGGEVVRADLNALVRAHVVLAYQGFRAADRGFVAAIVEDYGASLEAVPLCYPELSRVVLNLVANACHALRERARGGEAGFSPRLVVGTRRDGDVAEIRVADNGVGIPAEIQARIFDPFFTTKPPGEGTGLGLSLCYDVVVALLGGTIAVESSPGGGATFTVRFPLGGWADPASGAGTGAVGGGITGHDGV